LFPIGQGSNAPPGAVIELLPWAINDASFAIAGFKVEPCQVADSPHLIKAKEPERIIPKQQEAHHD
jgi:hypothetical protein